VNNAAMRNYDDDDDLDSNFRGNAGQGLMRRFDDEDDF